ncbi:uncharacterized protein LOC131938220 [Physella acuta]|uniref:uncharacterized protein LOC131938220 n=1 Tax=Physella acuta TaxID=109671 RepID=UPI0027DDCD5F|nr:uncharacterized protein LOC131938220 [Physella acuta]
MLTSFPSYKDSLGTIDQDADTPTVATSPSKTKPPKVITTATKKDGIQLISYQITPKPPPEPLPFPFSCIIMICCGGNMKYLVFPTLMAVSLGLFLAFSRAVSSTSLHMGYSQYQNSRELSEDEPSVPQSHMLFGNILKDHAAMFHPQAHLLQQQQQLQAQQQQMQQNMVVQEGGEGCDCSRCEVDRDFINGNVNQHKRLVKHSFQHFYGKPELATQIEAFVPSKKKRWELSPVFYVSANPVCGDDSIPLAVILVHTRHRHMTERNVVRETWGRVARGHPWPHRQMPGEVKLVFVLEVSEDPIDNNLATKESEKYGDIVLVDVQETRRPATRNILAGFKWVLDYCSGAQYVIKVEEDTFLDVPLMLTLLAYQDLTNMIFGPIVFDASVKRVTEDNKLLVSKQAYFPEVYPPYAMGNVYAMPTTLAKRILNIAEYLPYVSLEDVFITGIVAKVFDVRHINIPEGLFDRKSGSKPELCDFVYRRKIAAQGVKSAMAHNLWRRLEKSEMCGLFPTE